MSKKHVFGMKLAEFARQLQHSIDPFHAPTDSHTLSNGRTNNMKTFV